MPSAKKSGKGGSYRNHKREPAIEKAHPDGLRQALLEQGYKKTTVAQIVHEAGVSNSTFQNIFRAKDGVLTELVEFMFGNQFAMARQTAGQTLPPIYVYRGRDSHSDDAHRAQREFAGNLS